MKNQISYWLKQIVEDDPIPYEIKHIVFIIQNYCLSVGGYELLPKIIYEPEFQPLEAQYMFYNDLYKIKQLNAFLETVITEIDEAFYDNEIKNIFIGKKIYVSQFGCSPQFLFKA